MKKIIFTTIFSLFSFGLMAQGDHAFIIGFGGASNTVSVSQRSTLTGETQYSPYAEETGFNAKYNFSLGYLKQTPYLNNKLSLGADFTMFFSDGLNNRITVRPDFTASGGMVKSVDNTSLYSYTAMFIANYQLLQISKLEFIAQLGAGLILNTINRNVTNTFYLADGTELGVGHNSGFGTSGSLATRAGLIGNYNMFDRLAIGVGVYYTYAGATTKTNVAGSELDYRIKNEGTTSYNLHLIWRV
ncbi:MAG: hypothetical protein LBH40_03685 [Alphaproteobacteria bacterium]|nr:hypothetical protein [Alphaproteobacteria bacterium]